MCQFFSFITTKKGKYLYLNAEQRKGLDDPDSHGTVCLAYHKKENSKLLNAYEYNPLTKVLVQYSIMFNEDLDVVQKWCENLDFKTIVPELIIKPIINPFEIEHGRVTDLDIQRLHEWISVGISVSDRVSDRVWYSVGNSIWDSAWDSIGTNIWTSVLASVSVSVSASVRAYISSFFDLDGKQRCFKDFKGNPFQSCIDLWESGLVPSFDGETWRLHSKNGIVYELEKEKQWQDQKVME